MQKFKIGDKVEIIAVSNADLRWDHWGVAQSRTKGFHCEVEHIDHEGDIRVRSSQFTHGFNTLWYPAAALRLVVKEDEAIKVVYKVGDEEFDSEAEAKDHIARKLLTALVHPDLSTWEKVEALAKNKEDVKRLLDQVIL